MNEVVYHKAILSNISSAGYVILIHELFSDLKCQDDEVPFTSQRAHLSFIMNISEYNWISTPATQYTTFMSGVSLTVTIMYYKYHISACVCASLYRN